MSDPSRPIGEEDLHAWIDGQLDADRQPVVWRHLQEHPDVARRVAAWREQRDALRAVFAPVAAEPVPPRLRLEACDRAQLSYGDRGRQLADRGSL